MSGYVHWHEGMFLLPHHLQAMQRSISKQFTRERSLVHRYPYGVVQARLSAESLGNMLLSFDELHVVMPSGLEVRVPHDGHLPTVSFKERFEASTEPINVRLGVPHWQKHRPNTIEAGNSDFRPKRLFRVEEVDCPDENTGKNAKPVPLRQVNARLLLEGDDETDLDVLPLFRITATEGGSRPVLDDTFIPPCLIHHGWPTLRELTRDMSHHIEAARSEMVRQMKRDGFNPDSLRGKQIPQLMRLQTLNRFTARLSNIAAEAKTTPFEFYLEVRDMLGELAALDPLKDQFAVPAYNHDQPGPIFFELAKRVRSLARAGPSETFLAVGFDRETKPDRFVVELEQQHFESPNEYFLGLRTREDPRQLDQLVEDTHRCKLMPFSKSGKPIFGVQLERVQNPPVQLPVETGLHYFRMLRERNARWNEIVEEKKIVLEGAVTDIGDLQATLYMTVPSYLGEGT
ncbi:MAG: type VI secretion system baseplate subunit TssK [Phycisphaerales bacterium]|nr:MAG: type VI secretion system baseplate subunit TssK [Phycisphaerales bacterium]